VPARRVADRPVSAALLATVVLFAILDPNVPLPVTEVAILLVVVPLLRLVQDRLPGRLRTAVPVVVGLFLVARLRRLLPAVSPTARLLLLAENLAFAAWVLWAIRPSEIARLVQGDVRRRAVLWAARGVVVLLGAAVIANVAGAVAFALVVTQSLADSAFLGLGLYATTGVLEGLALAAIRGWALYGGRAVARHEAAVRSRVAGLLRLAAVIVWVAGTLNAFGVLRPVVDAVRGVLGATLDVGAVSVSLGDVLAFALTVWLAFGVSRIVRVILEDDVLPRMALPRGVPSAISAAASWALLFLGFLFALTVAGVDVGRVTILAGAFGVGIGFGLQNVVHNFVSGLILLVERPMRIGDVVEVGAVTGRVLRIGVRSSTIRTFEGADVIVPNGTLIAGQVTNWTFSDYHRRVDVKIAVDHGSDVERVRAILEDVVKAEPGVLASPPSQVLLDGFGDGKLSLTVRVWTARFELAAEVRSRLVAGMLAALRAAGIQIR
jgi:small-conductance mechanosensitive channel